MKELLFACPGIPASAQPRNILSGISRVRELGLSAMELEWVRSIHVNKDKVQEVLRASKEHGVLFSCHGQYWVNLSSKESDKRKASIQRMIDAAVRASELDVYSITWHFGFYQGRDKEVVFRMIRDSVKEVVDSLDDKKIWLRPETTGKPTQWGDLDECIRLSREFSQVLPCIDFSHLHARSLGKENSYDEFHDTLSKVEKHIGKPALKNMHMHLSGIEYGPKGERHHLNLEESDMRWRELLNVLKEFDVAGVLTTESPNIEEDALLVQKTYKQI